MICLVPHEETTKADFQFDAKEGSSRRRLLKWMNPVCGLMTASGVAPERMTHRGQMWSIGRYSNRYRSRWQAFTMDRNTLVSSRLVLRPRHAGDVCIVYRVQLATRSVDLLPSCSAIVYTRSEVQWANRADHTSHWRCGTCDGASSKSEGCTNCT